MKLRITLQTSILLFVICSFSSCLKKGKDDPFISLRTRKARIVGNWTMIKGSKTEEIFGSTIETNYTKNGYELKTFSNGTQVNSDSGESKFTLNFFKNGKVEIVRELKVSGHNNLSGTWSFAGGVGKVKNKEQITIHDEEDPHNTDIVYFIKELRDKKLVLFREGKTFKETYEFAQ